jgi:myo-inositol-1(or 4)-monophosphatase
MLALAVRLAREAGAMALPRLGAAAAGRKADDSVVTEVDREIEAHVTSAIRDAHPDHEVLGEETHEHRPSGDRPGGYGPGGGRFCWVIDPLDGTRNFVAGLPCFAISIAVLDRGQPIVGVVYEPNLDRLYTATLGGGAMFNGARVAAREPEPGTDLLVGVASSKDELSVRVLQKWGSMPGIILRNLGSSALHLALVASGALSAAFGVKCKIWDIAAGVLLVSEAGGVVTSPTGAPLIPFDLSRDPRDNLPILAGPSGVHQRLLGLMPGACSVG